MVLSWRIFMATARDHIYVSKYMATPRPLMLKYGERYLNTLMDEIDSPIPIHTKKHKVRKYNQAQRLEKQIQYMETL